MRAPFLVTALLATSALFTSLAGFGQAKPDKKKKLAATYSFFEFAENREYRDRTEKDIALTDSLLRKHSQEAATLFHLSLDEPTRYRDIAATLDRLGEFEANTHNITVRGHGAVEKTQNRFVEYVTDHTLSNDTISLMAWDARGALEPLPPLSAATLFRTMGDALTAQDPKHKNKVRVHYASCYPLAALVGVGHLPPGAEVLFLEDEKNVLYSYRKAFAVSMDGVMMVGRDKVLENFAAHDQFIETAMMAQNGTAGARKENWNRRPYLAFVTAPSKTEAPYVVIPEDGAVPDDTVRFGPNPVRVLDFRTEAVRYFDRHKEKDARAFFDDYLLWFDDTRMENIMETWRSVKNEKEFDEKLTDEEQRFTYLLTYRTIKEKKEIDLLPSLNSFYEHRMIENRFANAPKPPRVVPR